MTEQRQFEGQPYYCTFTGEISARTTDFLMAAIIGAVKAGVSELNFIFTSTGGRIDQALSLYTLIRGLKIPCNFHNLHIIASAGIPIFMAGKKRTAHDNAVFLLHRHYWQSSEGTKIDGRDINEYKAVSDFIARRYIDTLTANSNLDETTAREWVDNSRLIDAKTALQHRIIDEIVDFEIPRGPNIEHILSES